MPGGHELQPIGANFTPTPGPKKPEAVIARLPKDIKMWMMLMSFSNTLVWICFGVGWLNFGTEEAPVAQGKYALSAIAVFWCAVVCPAITLLITKIDWGQRGGS